MESTKNKDTFMRVHEKTMDRLKAMKQNRSCDAALSDLLDLHESFMEDMQYEK